MIKTYSDLRRLSTIEERYEYLKLGGTVGRDTFGYDRYLNQEFYRSALWRRVRKIVIARDLGCELGVDGWPIRDQIYVHHMNPMIVEDLVTGNDDVLDPEFLICVSHDVHNAIHYGDNSAITRRKYVERRPGDTKLW